MEALSAISVSAGGKSFFPISAFFSDVPFPANQTIEGNANTIFSFINSIFETELWQGLTVYAPASTTDTAPAECINQLRTMLPGFNVLPADYVHGSEPLTNVKVEVNKEVHELTSEVKLYNASRLRAAVIYAYRLGIAYPASPYFSYVRFESGFTACQIILFVNSPTILSNGKYTFPELRRVGSPGGVDMYGFYSGRTINIYVHFNGSHQITSAQFTFSPVLDEATLYVQPGDYEYWQGIKVPEFSTDPYAPGGNSGGGGGGGSFDGSSDPVGLPGLPTIELSDLGFFNLYNPSPAQIRALSDYMWSDTPNWDDFKKIMANPMDAIIGLSCVPVSVPNGAATPVNIGNIDTGLFMFPVTSQWVTHSCGSITIPEYWGSYLDYAPYTSIQLFLPYIGIQSVSANDLLSHAGKTLTLQYNVDVLSGACVASLLCGSSVLYNWQGSCGMQVPFTSLTYGNLINGLLQVGAGAVSALANPLGGLSSMISGGTSMFNQDISRGGGVGGAGGFLGIQTPYFIITRPNMCMPTDQNAFIGYPSFITVSLADLTGYTQVESIHIENVPATSAEIEEIESLLKSGVIM